MSVAGAELSAHPYTHEGAGWKSFRAALFLQMKVGAVSPWSGCVKT